MKRWIVLVVMVFVIAIGSFILGLYIPEEKTSSIVSIKSCDINQDSVLREINNLRDKDVVVAGDITEFAQQRAIEVSSNFSHDGFDGSADRLGYKLTGENLATGYCYTEELINSWLNSPTHKEVMLDSRYDYIGIEFYKNVVVTIYGDSQ